MKWFRVLVLQSLLYLGLTITHMQSSGKMELRPAGQRPFQLLNCGKPPGVSEQASVVATAP